MDDKQMENIQDKIYLEKGFLNLIPKAIHKRKN